MTLGGRYKAGTCYLNTVVCHGYRSLDGIGEPVPRGVESRDTRSTKTGIHEIWIIVVGGEVGLTSSTPIGR